MSCCDCACANGDTDLTLTSILPDYDIPVLSTSLTSIISEVDNAEAIFDSSSYGITNFLSDEDSEMVRATGEGIQAQLGIVSSRMNNEKFKIEEFSQKVNANSTKFSNGLNKYQQEFSKESQRIQNSVQVHNSDVQKEQQRINSNVSKYQAEIQKEGTRFNANIAKYQSKVTKEQQRIASDLNI